MNKNTNIVCYSLFDDEDLTSYSCKNATIVDNAIDENIHQDINNCNEEQTIHQFKEWEDKSHLKGYKQNKRCSKCGRPIPDKNKKGISQGKSKWVIIATIAFVILGIALIVIGFGVTYGWLSVLQWFGSRWAIYIYIIIGLLVFLFAFVIFKQKIGED